MLLSRYLISSVFGVVTARHGRPGTAVDAGKEEQLDADEALALRRSRNGLSRR